MIGDGSGHWPRGSLLGLLPAAEQAAFLRLGTTCTVGRNETLLREGDPGRHIFLLLRGIVKVMSSTVAGDLVVLAVRVMGDVVGEIAALDGGPRSATVVTATRSTVNRIGHADLGRHLAERPDVASAMNRIVTGKLRQATRFRVDRAGNDTVVRLARLIDQLGATYGVEVRSGRLLDVRLSQPELAALMGVGQASVERALAALRLRGLVRTGHRQILVCDVDGLHALATGAEP